MVVNRDAANYNLHPFEVLLPGAKFKVVLDDAEVELAVADY